ncbi:CotO family spore coat protein [Gracilibacillus sp. YIM 98692]|uniref:CotO family spore coat protein n=1 Tax=Gracilibacillus sp. YIM 98692 TaxID=2663532 RepID=UPI0013D5D19A|nr:CotO family spore coat protein [Gracilibacillus sp. YIM 98692]
MAKRRTHIPKIYVDQPDFVEPNAYMQHVFKSNNKTKTKAKTNLAESEQQSITTVTPRNKKRKRRQDEKEEAVEEIVQEEVDEKEKKRFQDMTVQEKVSYFTEKPFHVPRAKCKIVTDKKTYFGYILDQEGDEVFIQMGSKSTSSSISLEQIEEIELVGF